MAKQLGRKLTYKRDGEAVANLRTKSLSVNNNMVDVSDDDSSGWRELLDEPGQVEVNWTVSGVMDADTFRSTSLSKSVIKGDEIEYDDGGTISGDFALASYSEEHTYNDAVTFEAELQSSGTITYSPAT